MPRNNTLKSKLAAGKPVLGTWCEMASPTAANVAANAGLDFVIIDMEHGPMSLETAEMMIRSVEAEGSWPIIRVTENHDPTILRALELGGQAVLVPHVESAEEARRVVNSCKYHPEGNRGLGPYTRNHNYTHDGLSDSLAATNKETWVGILVEGKDGLARIDEIAQVPGIDLVYLGIYDISQSVGLPGQLRHPTVLDAVKKSAELLKRRGVAAGSYAPDPEYARMLLEAGMQFIAYTNDCFALKQHYVHGRKAILGEWEGNKKA